MESLERPLSKGWRRSRTERSTSTPKKPAFDVYYWPPGEQRQKLRSIVDVSKYCEFRSCVCIFSTFFLFFGNLRCFFSFSPVGLQWHNIQPLIFLFRISPSPRPFRFLVLRTLCLPWPKDPYPPHLNGRTSLGPVLQRVHFSCHFYSSYVYM